MYSIEPFCYLTQQLEGQLQGMKLTQSDIIKALAVSDTFAKKQIDLEHEFVEQPIGNSSIEQTDIGSKSLFAQVFEMSVKRQGGAASWGQSGEFEVVEKQYRQLKQQSDGLRELVRRNRENMQRNKEKIQKFKAQKQQLEAEKKSQNDCQKIGNINPKLLLDAPRKEVDHTKMRGYNEKKDSARLWQQTIKN